MSKHTMTDGLVCRWVPVADESGRTHMEARWMPAVAAVRSAA